MAAVARHLPPEPGLTEVRVHGVGGATPEVMLEQTGVHQATGDTIAGFFRGTIHPPGRVVEAYSWGGLTARSRSRALWVLLLPFTLINLAGWMVEPEPSAPPGRSERPERRGSPGRKWHEVLVQLVGLFATALYVAWAAQLALNMVAFQCGAIPACRRDRWYVSYFDWGFFTDSPGRRVVVALVVPLGLLLLFGLLGRRSARRYDEYRGGERQDFTADRAGDGPVLTRPGLWFPGPWRAQLVLAHLAITLLLLAGLLGRASREFEIEFGVEVVPDLGYPLFGLCLTAGVVVAGTVGWATWRRRPVPEPTRPVLAILRVMMAVAVLAMAVAVVLTWQLDVPDDRLVTRVEADSGRPAEATTDLWGFGWAPIMLLALGIGAVAAFSFIQLWRWLIERRFYLDQFAVVVMGAFIVLWRQAFWVAVAALAGAAVALVVGQSNRRDPQQRDDQDTQAGRRWRRWWPWGLLAAVCLAGAATQRLTVTAPGPFGPDWPRLTPLLLFTAILVLLTVGHTSGWGPNDPAGRKPWPVPVALAGLPVVLIGPAWAVYGWWGGSIGWLVGAALLSWLLLAVAWLAQFREPGLDRWRWNGPAAAGALALATLMGAFAALATWLADLLGGDGSTFVLSATAIYEWVALMFAGMLVAILLGFVVWLGLVRLGIGRPGTGGPPFYRRRRRADPQPVTLGGRTLAEAVRGGDVVLTMGTLLLAGAVLALVAHLAGEYRWELQLWIDDRPPGDWQPVVQLALLVCLATVFGWFLLVRRGLRDQVFRTRIGVLWDTATFWPRWFHPFAPPAYSTRAVPELQTRLAEVTSRGGAVVLSAHSQGSVVAVAALASLDPPLLERIRLVTHGSPLTRFYHRFFPSYFSRELLDDGARRLGTTSELADGGWLNFWRATDPIGDPVFGPCERPPPPDRPPAGVREALERHGRTLTTLPDVELDDPLLVGPDPYRPRPAIRGHSGYAADPAMWETLAALADELRERLGTTD